jgi:hypothetical protein
MMVTMAQLASTLLGASLQPPAIHFQNSEDRPKGSDTLHLQQMFFAAEIAGNILEDIGVCRRIVLKVIIDGDSGSE